MKLKNKDETKYNAEWNFMANQCDVCTQIISIHTSFYSTRNSFNISISFSVIKKKSKLT